MIEQTSLEGTDPECWCLMLSGESYYMAGLVSTILSSNHLWEVVCKHFHDGGELTPIIPQLPANGHDSVISPGHWVWQSVEPDDLFLKNQGTKLDLCCFLLLLVSCCGARCWDDRSSKKKQTSSSTKLWSQMLCCTLWMSQHQQGHIVQSAMVHCSEHQIGRDIFMTITIQVWCLPDYPIYWLGLSARGMPLASSQRGSGKV